MSLWNLTESLTLYETHFHNRWNTDRRMLYQHLLWISGLPLRCILPTMFCSTNCSPTWHSLNTKQGHSAERKFSQRDKRSFYLLTVFIRQVQGYSLHRCEDVSGSNLLPRQKAEGSSQVSVTHLTSNKTSPLREPQSQRAVCLQNCTSVLTQRGKSSETDRAVHRVLTQLWLIATRLAPYLLQHVHSDSTSQQLLMITFTWCSCLRSSSRGSKPITGPHSDQDDSSPHPDNLFQQVSSPISSHNSVLLCVLHNLPITLIIICEAPQYAVVSSTIIRWSDCWGTGPCNSVQCILRFVLNVEQVMIPIHTNSCTQFTIKCFFTSHVPASFSEGSMFKL